MRPRTKRPKQRTSVQQAYINQLVNKSSNHRSTNESVVNGYWLFTRPHTILGTSISIVSMSFMAKPLGMMLCSSFGIQLSQAMICALSMNVAIVGLNQVYDKKIDTINKPNLPLVSGALTTDAALTAISLACSMSLIYGSFSTSFHLLMTLVSSLLLGIVYSADIAWLRWKQVPTLAMMCITTVRAFVVQWGFYGYFATPDMVDTPISLSFSIFFMVLYSGVIAILKDTPDIVGDAKSGVRTVVLRVQAVLRLCLLALFLAYSSGVYVSVAYSKTPLVSTILIVGHVCCFALVVAQYLKTEQKSSASLYTFYMLIWKLFYFEYLLFPFF